MMQLGNNHNRFEVKYQAAPGVLNDVCLFSSFSFTGIVEEYVFYYLEALRKAGFSIAFISTSALRQSCIDRLSALTFLIIERENQCPDFGSWKIALSLLHWGKNLNAVLLTNDSVFGPFFDLRGIIDSSNSRYDVWGMTENHEISPHLQSYFLYFNKKSVNNNVFAEFWQNVDLEAGKDEVVRRYEVGLSVLFRQHGFILGAYAATNALADRELPAQHHINPTLLFWKTLIAQHRFPFMKRELLIRADIAVAYWTTNLYINTSGWRDTISRHADYPVALIEQFMVNYTTHLNITNNAMILRKRKVLFICHDASNTEAQRMVIYFLQWLKKETLIEAEIIVCNKSTGETVNELAELGIVTHLYELSPYGRQRLKHRLAEEIALIFSFTIENIATQRFLSILNVPQLMYVHEPAAVIKKWMAGDEPGWLLNHVTHFIAANNTTQKSLADQGIPATSIDVLYKFVPASPLPEKNLLAVALPESIPAGAFVVAILEETAGNSEGHSLPLLAATLCKEANAIHLLWLGNGRSVYEAARPALEKAGLTKRVHLASHAMESGAYYPQVNILVLLCGEDAFPLLMLQYGLSGKPVVCFNNASAAIEYINMGTGYAVPYLNLVKLTEKIFDYYQRRHQMSEESDAITAVVKRNFTVNVQAPKLLQFIRKYYKEEELLLKEEPCIAFLTHLYYENTWPEIRNKLKNFDNGKNYFLFSISDACLAKETLLGDIKKTFKNVYFLVTSNIGKDIGGKLALIDLYLLLKLPALYIVFLHDKQSPHSAKGESWKNGLFKVIDYNNQKLILQCFKDPAIGIVGSREHIVNEYDPGTGQFVNNSQLSKKMLLQFDMAIDNYDFLGGTIYWMRASVIRHFFSKNHPVYMRRNLEAGNVMDLDGERLAHTWERIFSWMSTHQGYSIKGI